MQTFGEQVWRDNDDLEAQFGLDPLAMMGEIRRLESKVNVAYQMADHFRGNANATQSDGTPFPKGPVSDAWETAGRMLRGSLDD